MAVTRVKPNEWMVEIVDPLTRQNGSYNLKAQFLVRVDGTGIQIRPWRVVQDHDEEGVVAYPLPATPEVLAAYQPVVLMEMLAPLVRLWDVHQDTATDSDTVSADDLAKYLLEGSL